MANNQKERGSVAFFSTYRPPVPLDLYWSPISPKSSNDESIITDGMSYNYNGREIPPGALKTLLRYTKMGQSASVRDVNNGDVKGYTFVSERTNNLETLHFAVWFKDPDEETVVYNFAQLYNTFAGVRMEDSGCFAGDRYFIYASTKERNPNRRQPWTAVYRTDLSIGQTIRLTPKGVVDFSPSVSPSGSKIAVASLQFSAKWSGEIEDLKTDIVVMNVTPPFRRWVVIKNGGWPSWGSENILYFHRATQRPGHDGKTYYNWGVFRSQIREGFIARSSYRVTPTNVDAMTPAAIDEYRVAVAIVRQKLDLDQRRTRPSNYRHIEVFDLRSPNQPLPVTQIIYPMADHFNPFVITIRGDDDDDDEVLIGYNCCIDNQLKKGDVTDSFDMLQTKCRDQLEVFRVPGVFPTFTSDGQKLAFVDNDFKNVYLADSRGGLRIIFSVSDLKLPEGEDNVFSPVWSQNPQRDELYICVGPPFSATKEVHIYIIYNASTKNRRLQKISWRANNAFPSTNPEGTKLVFRSTMEWVGNPHKSPIRPKNLYIFHRGMGGVKSTFTRMTYGDWIDTHCQWSPNGQWIVFSSTRDKAPDAPNLDNGLDPGYYSIYMMKANDPRVVVRVVRSGIDGAGHVNHPMFSPDGNSIIFAADLTGVSVEPISLPLFLHSVRPYGDIFSVNINKNDIFANKDLMEYNRVTHSRYENSTPNWSMFTTRNLSGAWKKLFNECHKATWHCPFANGAQTWESTGHLGLSKRCC